MKLTKEQIQYITITLELNDVVYEDVKIEILDHIASDIEYHMENDSIDFETSFYMVFDKWKKELQPTTNSLWLGNFFEGPKIVVDKWVSNVKKTALNLAVFSLVLGIIVTVFFQNHHEENTLIIANHLIQSLFLFCALVTVVGLLLLWKSKIKTTYSRLFKRRSLLVIYPLLIGLGLMRIYLYSDSFYAAFFLNLFNAFLFSYSILNLNRVVDHFKTIKRHQLYKI